MSTATATASVRERARVSGCENCASLRAHFANQALRFRNRSRLTGGFRASLALSDAIAIEDFVPDAVGTNDVVDGEVRLSFNGAERVGSQFNITDDDACVARGLEKGLDVELQITVGGRRIATQRHCISPTTPSIATFTFETGRSPGTATLEVDVVGNGTGNLLGTSRIDVEVGAGEEEEAEIRRPAGEEPSDEEEEEDGEDGPFLPCFLDPNRSCATPETAAWGAAAVLVLTLLVSR